MRIAIKTVKGKKYIQYVDSRGHIYHVGPAVDFDSWLLALVFWNKEWNIECEERKTKFFHRMENEMNKFTELDWIKFEAIDAVRYQMGRKRSIESRRWLHLPEMPPFGKLRIRELNEPGSTHFVWDWNEWAIQLQTRLNEFCSKQRKRERKERQLNSHPENTAIEQVKRFHRYKTIGLSIRKDIAEKTVSYLKNNENKPVQKWKLYEELQKMEYDPNDVISVIQALLREGILYEPYDGFYRIT